MHADVNSFIQLNETDRSRRDICSKKYFFLLLETAPSSLKLYFTFMRVCNQIGIQSLDIKDLINGVVVPVKLQFTGAYTVFIMIQQIPLTEPVALLK